MSNRFNISSFYGKTNNRKRCQIQQRLEETVEEHKRKRIPEEFKQRITGPICDWRPFFRQQDAFSYATSRSSDLHVFAYESETLGTESGKRMYLVSEYRVFWHYYKQIPVSKRNHYEIIPEGAVCKLYFDLEFPREQNPGRNGDQMVDTLIQYVCAWLRKLFRVECQRDSIIDFDASTEKKFSRHLIFLMHNKAFQDNIHTGNFVRHIMSKLRQRCQRHKDEGIEKTDGDHPQTNSPVQVPDRCGQEGELWSLFSEEELCSLIVKNKNMDEVMFCDLGVYTKNRNFRLYKSCKYGKNNPLVQSEQNRYVPQSPGKKESIDSGEQLFLDSLVANVKYSENLKVLTFAEDGTSQQQYGRLPCRTGNSDQTVDGHQSSPYPEVDQFILSFLERVGPIGFIRHWTYFANGEMIVYEIGKNRWCANIGRCHKSNNIMIVADLKKRIFYQKCLDPDCRSVNFRSDDYPLPAEVLQSYFCDDDEFFDGEDLDLLNASDSVEVNIRDDSKRGKYSELEHHVDDTLDDSGDEDFVNAVEILERSVPNT